MNIGFVLLGVLTFCGVVLTWRAWPKTRLAKLGLALIAFGSIGPVISGICPENISPDLHTLGALAYFLIGSTGIVLLGLGLRHHSRWAAAQAIFCGAVSLARFFAYASEHYLGLGRGVIERMAADPSILRLTGTGAALLLSQIQATMQVGADRAQGTGARRPHDEAAFSPNGGWPARTAPPRH